MTTSGGAMITPCEPAHAPPELPKCQEAAGECSPSANIGASGREELGHDDRQNDVGDQIASTDPIMEQPKDDRQKDVGDRIASTDPIMEQPKDDRQKDVGDPIAPKDPITEQLKCFLHEELLRMQQVLQDHYSDGHQELVHKLQQFAMCAPGESQNSSPMGLAATPAALAARAAKPSLALPKGRFPVPPPEPGSIQVQDSAARQSAQPQGSTARQSAQQHEEDSQHQDVGTIPGILQQDPRVAGPAGRDSLSSRVSDAVKPRESELSERESEVSGFDGILHSPGVQPDSRLMKRHGTSVHRKNKRVSVKFQTEQKVMDMLQVEKHIHTHDFTCKERMFDFVHGPYLDTIMTIVIFINAMTMGLEVEFHTEGPDSELAFSWLGRAFAFIYLVELLLRLSVDGFSFFRNRTALWNLFDLFLVIIMVADELIQVTDSLVDMLKLLRLCRIVRLVRVVRLIPSMKHTLYLVWASMGSFGWTALLMLLIMYGFALFFTEVSTSFLQETEKLDVTDERILNLKANWGHLSDSMKSLFMAITGGEDWRVLSVGLGHQSIFNSCVFYFYVTFMTLVMLNLVTGVFVEGAQRRLAQEAEDELIAGAVKCFVSMDEDVNGTLSFHEFCAHCADEAVLGFCRALDILPDQAKELFLLLDKDKSGELSLLEFAVGCLRFRQPARALDVSTLMLELRDLKDILKTELTFLSKRLGRDPPPTLGRLGSNAS